MKILIVNNMAPFIWGGAEELAVHLQKNLILLGYQAEILRIPFQWEPAHLIPSQMLMVRTFELYNVDHVIALKFPAYLIPHPQKTLWLLHQYRQAYDLFEVGQTNLPDNSLGSEIQTMIKNADNECFKGCRALFSNSEITKERLLKYNGFNSEILYPPLNDPELFKNESLGDYIFAGGRINDMKRQHLLLSAMRYADKKVKLMIAGPPDTLEDEKKLKEMIIKYNLKDRVKLDLRFLPRKTYVDYINNAAAVAYLPFDEDSLGYVAMEGASAKKAIITTSDSGGILGLVKHKKTGWVAEPIPEFLAEVMNAVFENQRLQNEYGQAAQFYWENMNINWPQTIKKLLA